MLFSPSGEKQVPHSVETGQLVVNQLKSPVGKIRRISRRRKLAPLVLVKHNAENERLGVGDNGAQRRRTGGDAALAEAAEAQRLAAEPLAGRVAVSVLTAAGDADVVVVAAVAAAGVAV